MAAADTQRADAEADDDERVESGTATSLLPTAVVVPKGEAPTAPPDPFRALRRGLLLAALVLGWTLILYVNRFNLSAPTVFVCLGYLAVISTGYALWRTGMVVVTEEDEDADSTWGRPLGRRTELEREKKTLLKAIKEAEFDREMGKLSKADADEMIAVYRVRAIEVIKQIDEMDAGSAGTVREQIERELKARLELETKADKAKKDAIADATKDKKKKEAQKAKPAPKDSATSKEPATTASEAASDVAPTKSASDATTADAPTNTAASTKTASDATTAEAAPTKTAASTKTGPDAAPVEASAAETVSSADESTPAKEATS